MKKILNLVLICSVLTISSTAVLAKDKAAQANVNIAKNRKKYILLNQRKIKRLINAKSGEKMLKMPKAKRNHPKKQKACMKQNSR